MKKQFLVVSDLHVSAGPLDDFGQESESKFIAFLKNLDRQKLPTELVIAGDFMDFPQASAHSSIPDQVPVSVKINNKLFLCFTEKQSVSRAKHMVEKHQALFDALSEFLKSKNHKITILPGNHDVDLFWKKLQQLLRGVIQKDNPGNLYFHTKDYVYSPLKSGILHIEHGHRFDPPNSFQKWGMPFFKFWGRNPSFKDADGTLRMEACLGTRFILHYINPLREHFPYISKIKPFSKIARLAITTKSLRALTAIVHLGQFISKYTGPGEFLNLEPTDISEVKKAWREQILKLYDEKTSFGEDLYEILRKNSQWPSEHQYGSSSALEMDLRSDKDNTSGEEKLWKDTEEAICGLSLDDWEKLFGKSEPPEADTLELMKGYVIDEGKAMENKAVNLLDTSQAQVIVMGHTHQIAEQTSGVKKYYNSGCWIPYLDFGKAEREGREIFWNELKANAENNQWYPLDCRFVQIVQDGKTITSQMVPVE